jgi:hypothetical protein
MNGKILKAINSNKKLQCCKQDNFIFIVEYFSFLEAVAKKSGEFLYRVLTSFFYIFDFSKYKNYVKIHKELM